MAAFVKIRENQVSEPSLPQYCDKIVAKRNIHRKNICGGVHSFILQFKLQNIYCYFYFKTVCTDLYSGVGGALKLFSELF